ncbi:unnamed protein product, partial [Rangifer tarandus platyrhynchus]
RAQLFVTLWTMACQALLTMGFPGQWRVNGSPYVDSGAQETSIWRFCSSLGPSCHLHRAGGGGKKESMEQRRLPS